MDPGQGEKGLALPTPCKTFVLSRWMSNFFEPQAYWETTARSNTRHFVGYCRVAGRMSGWSVPTWRLAGCLAEQGYGRAVVWNINCAK